jgi:hypothetical protein
MSIRLYKPYTPGTRNRALSSFSEITTNKPEKTLVKKIIVIKVVIIEELLRLDTVVVGIKDNIESLILKDINIIYQRQ